MTTTFLIILLILVAGLLIYVIRLMLTMPSDDRRRADSILENPQHTPTEDELRLISDEIMSRIDRKIDSLKELMRRADEKIEKLNEIARLNNTLPNSVTTRNADGSETQFALKRNQRETAHDTAPPPPDNRRATIVNLHRKGFSPAAIARETGMGLGEIELILRIEGRNV